MQARVKKLVNGKFLPQIRSYDYGSWTNIEYDGTEYDESEVEDCVCNTYGEALDSLATQGVGYDEMLRDVEEVRAYPKPPPDKIVVIEPKADSISINLSDDLNILRDQILDSWKPKPSKVRVATETFLQKIRDRFQSIWKDIRADWKRVRNKS